MKIKFTLSFFVAVATWILFTNYLSDPPLASTGAPTESTCMRSGCHTGGTFTGTVVLTGLPDSVLPNTAYTITVTNTSDAVRSGFQLTCLDGSNAKCGTLAVGAGVNIASSATRMYARHSTYKVLSGGNTSWTFPWTSPATAANDSVKFYFASLCANGNGQDNGDNVLLGYKRVKLRKPNATIDNAEAINWLQISPTNVSDMLNINLLKTDKGTLELMDIQGKMVIQKELSMYNHVNINHLAQGMYIALVRTADKTFSQKIVKQ